VLLVRQYQYFTNDIAYDIALVPGQKSLSYIIAADNLDNRIKGMINFVNLTTCDIVVRKTAGDPT
jgi:hypothetical protein